MSDSFFVVFDTCTHAAYYSDLHQVLSLPDGAIIRYEYKRILFADEAAAEIERLAHTPTDLPLPVLLMYGEKRRFRHGELDPKTMLSTRDSTFVPTRSAELVGVAIKSGAHRSDDVLYMHLKLKGFIRPEVAAIQTMVAALESADSLPFGDKQQQYTWISLLPAALDAQRTELVSDDQEAWAAVIDKLVLAPTQFEHDVFWRVRGVFEEEEGASIREVQLVDRSTNERVHVDRYRRDYPLKESKRYVVTIETYSPEAHGANVPAGASIAMTSPDDDQAMLKLAADPLRVVPNQIDSKRFSVSTDAAFDTRFTGIGLETQVPAHTSQYPAGSECSLTFMISKDRLNVFAGVISVLLGTGIVGYVAGAKPDGITGGALSALAALLIALGGWFLRRQFILGK